MTQPAVIHRNLEQNVPAGLTSLSSPEVFACGTGLSLHRDVLLPAILNARREIVLATCFWAPSATLDELVGALKTLSAQVVTRAGTSKIKVYICFSSRSATQKVFHTASSAGHIVPANEWPKKLGLPTPQELPGLEITVKSLFFRPFSVLHSKYLIIDRESVFLPSCNVSWEDWYECVVGLRGPVVRHCFDFWRAVWLPHDLREELSEQEDKAGHRDATRTDEMSLSTQLLRTTLLPHPHNSSIRQALWLLPNNVAPLPMSPLNTSLLQLVARADTEVVMLTPNFTSMPALVAVSFALLRGVHVRLITNRRMMIPEQLATAGVLTEQFVDRLIKEYRRNFSTRKSRKRIARLADLIGSPLPAQRATVGDLTVSYFKQRLPQPIESTSDHSEAKPITMNRYTTGLGIARNANKSHIKLTLIDRTAIILGSGNMDRASWRTSQELGILIRDTDEAVDAASNVQNMWSQVERGLEGCLDTYFDR